MLNPLLPVTTDIPDPATPLNTPPIPLETEATTLELPLEEESEQAVLGAAIIRPSVPPNTESSSDTTPSFSRWLERTLMEINATINAWRNTYGDFP